MKASDRMEEILNKERGFTADTPCTVENLLIRQNVMAKVMDEMQEKIDSLERRLIVLDNL